MKKIVLITMMVLTVNANASLLNQPRNNGVIQNTVPKTGTNPGNTSNTGTNPGNTSNTGTNPGNTSNTGTNPGNFSTSQTGGEKPTTGSFSTSNSGVPKLSLEGLVAWVLRILDQLVYVIIGASLVAFLYGVLKLSLIDGHKPEAREQARKFMFWGIVSLFVMVSVWGLVNILQLTLFGGSPLRVPQLK